MTEQVQPVGQPSVDPAVLRAAMAENRSVWITNGLACYSLVISFIGFLMNFLFGAGILFGGVGGIMAFVAFNKSKKTGQGRGLSIAGLVANGAIVVFGLVVIVTLLAAAGSGSS